MTTESLVRTIVMLMLSLTPDTTAPAMHSIRRAPEMLRRGAPWARPARYVSPPTRLAACRQRIVALGRRLEGSILLRPFLRRTVQSLIYQPHSPDSAGRLNPPWIDSRFGLIALRIPSMKDAGH